jgi:hypothetical protein
VLPRGVVNRICFDEADMMAVVSSSLALVGSMVERRDEEDDVLMVERL